MKYKIHRGYNMPLNSEYYFIADERYPWNGTDMEITKIHYYTYEEAEEKLKKMNNDT